MTVLTSCPKTLFENVEHLPLNCVPHYLQRHLSLHRDQHRPVCNLTDMYLRPMGDPNRSGENDTMFEVTSCFGQRCGAGNETSNSSFPTGE